MDSELLEVKSGVLHTFDGDRHEVHGGAYLTPESYLKTRGELQRLRELKADLESSRVVPMLVLAAGLVGLAAGILLGRSSAADQPRRRRGLLVNKA